jgi:hypothetical protein
MITREEREAQAKIKRWMAKVTPSGVEDALPPSGQGKSCRRASFSGLTQSFSQRSWTNKGETDTGALLPSGLKKSGSNASLKCMVNIGSQSSMINTRSLAAWEVSFCLSI